MTVRLVLGAVAKKRHPLSLRQGLEQSQSKLLAVIFYHPISPVDCGRLKKFLPISSPEFCPANPARLEGSQ